MKIAYIYPEILPDTKARAISATETTKALSGLIPTTLIYEKNEQDNPPLKPTDNLFQTGLRKELFGIKSNRIFNYNLDKHLKENSYDALYVRHLKTAYHLLKHRRKYKNTKIIFECHEIFSVSNPKTRHLEETVYSQSDGLVFINQSLQKAIQKHFPNSSQFQEVIDNGCSFSLPYLKKSFQSPSFVYVGNFYPWKGVDFLIECMEYLPEVHLKIVGDGNRKEELEKKVKNLGMQKRISFLGYRTHNEIQEILKSSSFAVIPNIPSPYDTFSTPIKLYEYLASSSVVIAADMPTIREIVTDGKNGFLFKAGDRKSFIDTLKKVLDYSVSQLEEISKSGHEASKKFTWEARAAKIIKFSHKVIESKTI